MTERKLPINLEGLWLNPNQKFTLRFKDISKQYQEILSKRIKETAKQTSLRKPTGPTLELIEQVLNEINPIIFSEHIRDATWYRNHQVFGINAAVYIAGYRFQLLCQSVFLLTCRKKALTPSQITQIARLTYNDWEIADHYVNARLGITEEDEERMTPIENLGIDDIERAGENIENNNPIRRINTNDITPDAEYDTLPEEIPTAPLTMENLQRTYNIIQGRRLQQEVITPRINEAYTALEHRLIRENEREDIRERENRPEPGTRRGILHSFFGLDETSDNENTNREIQNAEGYHVRTQADTLEQIPSTDPYENRIAGNRY